MVFDADIQALSDSLCNQGTLSLTSPRRGPKLKKTKAMNPRAQIALNLQKLSLKA